MSRKLRYVFLQRNLAASYSEPSVMLLREGRFVLMRATDPRTYISDGDAATPIITTNDSAQASPKSVQFMRRKRSAQQRSNESKASGSSSSTGRKVLYAIGSNVVTPLTALAVAPILAHSLGVVGRGQVAGATAPLLLATAVATIGMPEAVIYTVARNHKALRASLTRAAVIVAASSAAPLVLIILFAPLLAASDAGLANLIVVSALAIIPVMLVTIMRASAVAIQRWRAVMLEQLFSSGARFALILGLLVAEKLTVQNAVIATAFAPLVGSLAYLPVLLQAARQPARRPKPGPYRKITSRGLLHYGSRVWVGTLSGIVLLRLDQFVMTPIAGVRELGYYVIAVSVAELVLVICNGVRDVTFSSQSTKVDGAALSFAARMSGSAALLVAALLLIPLPWWLPIAFGSQFQGAVAPCAVLLCSVVVVAPGSIAGVGLSARGQPGLRSAALGLGALVNVALLLLLLPPFGAFGASVATLVGNLVFTTTTITFLKSSDWRQFFGVRKSDYFHVKNRVVGTRLARTIHRLMRRPNP